MLMSRRFSYRKLKKLPPPSDDDDAAAQHQLQEQYYAAITAAAAAQNYHGGGIGGRRVTTWRSLGGGGRRRRRRPRVRISRLTRLIRRKAAAVGGAMRASVAKVVNRLKEGSPYIGDLFAGNYMFMQVTPSPTPAIAVAGGKKGIAVVPYHHQVGMIAAGGGGKNYEWQQSPAGVLYKV
uniref:Uncharacterized protein n=1 Tax=Leersia perrieri TaxID=77586 RepID=A0A0D9VA24_9ORYZ